MTHRSIVGLALGGLFITFGGACAVDTTGGEERDPAFLPAEGRGRTGKADLIGSCEPAQCGGKGTGQCWCDEKCVQYGDCCSNVNAVCSLGPNACASDEDCASGWCGWASDDVTRACKAFAQMGESCEGFVVPSAREKCDPSLECIHSEPTFDVPGTCQPASCDPTIICTQATTCVDGALYPTGCGPANCDEPIGICFAPPPPPPPEPTCANMCGGPAVDKICFCDAACSYYDDCCDDYAEHCE